MKNILLLVIVFLFTESLFSQIMVSKTLVDDVNRNEFLGDNGAVLDINNIKGSPYKNDNFIQGTVINESLNQKNTVGLRYNIYNDSMEFIDPKDNSIKMLLKSEDVEYIVGKDVFIYKKADRSNNIESGYYKVLIQDDKKISLYTKYNCIYIAPVLGKTPLQQSVGARFKTTEKRFILENRMMTQVPNRNKKKLELFSSDKKLLKKFIKKNKLNIKKERDFLRLVAYYNSLI